MSLLIKSRHYLPTTVCNHPPPPAPGQSGSAVALASLLLAPLTCPLRSPVRWPRLRGDEGSLFTGQAQIRFLTAPPEPGCQGKLAVQNCSLTGKSVSLFTSHSHWKKAWGGGREWLAMISFFPRNFSKALHFTVTSRHRLRFAAPHGTELARSTSFSSFSTALCPLPPPLSGVFTPCGFCRQPWKGKWKPRGG